MSQSPGLADKQENKTQVPNSFKVSNRRNLGRSGRKSAVTGHVTVGLPLPRIPASDELSVFRKAPRPAYITMAGNSHHPVHVHAARPLYRFTATALGASMWFFLMYRAKKDGPALLGWKHPWDH
ncbi:hypothetical protein N7513_007513 [Penicillium frequentans]|nr:hypothetical protein N7513_007513 [Penicillium glabrum]